jgi:uncharacterized repeat protein (TIGR01451 family)
MKFLAPLRSEQQRQNKCSFSELNIDNGNNIHPLTAVAPRTGGFALAKYLIMAIGGLAIPFMSSLSAQAAPLTCSTIYGDVYKSTQIYSISTSTAVPTAAATLPVPSNIGIAVIPGATSTSPPILYSDSLSPIHLNSTDGTTTTNNTTGTFNSTYGGGLGTDTSGRLFYIAKVGGVQHLWRFNSTTTAAVDAGAITSSVAGDTAWTNLSPGDMMSDANGRLYYFGSDYALTGGLYTNYLYYVDANFVAHRLGSYAAAQTGIGVAFDPSGTIYTLNRNLLYKIDMTAGFTASLIGDTKNAGFIDLASCAMPTMNPIVSAIKTVQDVTTAQNPATIVNTNDILQYSVTFTNTGNLPSDNTKFIDTIPPGTSYVSGSTQLCNAAGAACASIPDVSGAAPFLGTGTLVKTAGQAAGVLVTGAANNAILKFQVKVTSTGTPGLIVNTGQATYPTVSAGIPSTNTVSTTTTSVPIKVAPVTVSGTVFDDADGSKIKNGTEVFSTAPGLNAVLVDTSTGKVVVTTAVVSGAFSFSNVPANANYTVQITTAMAVIGSTPPAVVLPTNWASTGENLNGIVDSTIDSIIAVPVVVSNVTNVNLGIDQLPNTTDLSSASQVNPGGTATVQVSTLLGTDPEDNILGVVKNFKIVSLPTNGTLYYSGAVVSLGQTIVSYDPLLLTIDPTANTADIITFTYAAIDSAGQQDPTPATVTMPFSAPIVVAPPNYPNILLVKRITSINGSTNTTAGDDLANYKDTASPYDDNAMTILNPPTTVSEPQQDTQNWPTPMSFLLGGTNGGTIKPNSEMDYTIYFLSTGSDMAKGVVLCDLIPQNQIFVPTAFNDVTAGVGGLVGGDRGIIVSSNGISQSYTNLSDGDIARYYAPGETLPGACRKLPTDPIPSNNYGAIVVNLGNIPAATSPSTPDSYGFVRFRVKVK